MFFYNFARTTNNIWIPECGYRRIQIFFAWLMLNLHCNLKDSTVNFVRHTINFRGLFYHREFSKKIIPLSDHLCQLKPVLSNTFHKDGKKEKVKRQKFWESQLHVFSTTFLLRFFIRNK